MINKAMPIVPLVVNGNYKTDNMLVKGLSNRLNSLLSV